jgi:hypothetical protein
MSLTPNTVAAPGYLPVTEYLKRADKRTVADLCSDVGVRKDPSTLPNDPNLLAALLDASGYFESQMLKGNRYQPTDIQALPANSAGQAFVYRVLKDLTDVFLYQRRPDLAPQDDRLKWVMELMKGLADGENILPFIESQAAGQGSYPVNTAQDFQNQQLSSRRAFRYYGRRNNFIDPPA